MANFGKMMSELHTPGPELKVRTPATDPLVVCSTCRITSHCAGAPCPTCTPTIRPIPGADWTVKRGPGDDFSVVPSR